MVKLKKRCDEFNISSNNSFVETWDETDAESSERWDKAEQEMLEGKGYDYSYVKEKSDQFSELVRKILESGDINDDTCYENLLASIERYS